MRITMEESLWASQSVAGVALEDAGQESAGEGTTRQPARDSRRVAQRHHGPEERSRRRFQIKAMAQITRLDAVVVESEVVALVDASADGILFATNRDYAVGTQLLVRFPYPSSTSPKQMGSVVRVELLADGSRRVAIAIA